MAEAVTMWDFSWLLRRSGDEAEYVDVDRVLDELADRGYGTVRIDAFPHWIAPDSAGHISETIVATPQPPGFMWGNHHDVVVEPRAELLRFLQGLADRGLHAGLSTWFTPDREHRNTQIRDPADLYRVWHRTLQTIEEAGLAGTIRYVDLCNEWPGWSPGITDEVFGTDQDDRTTRPWTDDEVARMDRYQDALAELRSRHPDYPFTLSYFPRCASTRTEEDLMRLSAAEHDLAEIHLWLSLVCPRFIAQTDYVDNYSADVTNLTKHEHLVREQLATNLQDWLAELAQVMRQWSSWATDKGLPLWTTEGWASIGWSPDLVEDWDGWEYVKTVGQGAVELALEHGWTGICTSNFSQPHHTGMWMDAQWHRSLTDRIRAEPLPIPPRIRNSLPTEEPASSTPA